MDEKKIQLTDLQKIRRAINDRFRHVCELHKSDDKNNDILLGARRAYMSILELLNDLELNGEINE